MSYVNESVKKSVFHCVSQYDGFCITAIYIYCKCSSPTFINVLAKLWTQINSPKSNATIWFSCLNDLIHCLLPGTQSFITPESWVGNMMVMYFLLCLCKSAKPVCPPDTLQFMEFASGEFPLQHDPDGKCRICVCSILMIYQAGLGSKYFVLKYIFQSTKMYLSTFSNSKYMYLNCT